MLMAKTKRKSSRSNTKKVKKGAWFVNTRNSYMPVNFYGWLLYAPLIVAEVLLLAAVYAGLHEGVDVGTAYIQFFIGTAFIWASITWIARLKA